ncbi:uncharacterized protein LOC131852056 isoform X1 [Achroia grisella]|uniref:uncharacterized protein LOC131852056 isoform X1 n=1 Tax=Achroia grisella TaxID=688607 RepID=UPI0027D2324E|nr:uncharacterized protein LOC131852056 isoform X1 [Achroia grisella]
MKIVIIYFLLAYVKVTICLRVVSITVPKYKQRGEPATLTCDYDLEGGRLYSVKWYRDNEEFYRYMPRLRPPQHAHRLDGVKVDLGKSSARHAHLRELTLRSRGLYRCEVSEEAPSFHSAQAEAFMEVYHFPRDSPSVTGHERRYEIDEPLDVNCSSARSFPAPDLHWHINGQKITERSWLVAYGAKPVPQGLLVSTLGLKAPAKPRMKLRCVATIGTHKRERTVLIDTNSASCNSRVGASLLILTCVNMIVRDKIS